MIRLWKRLTGPVPKADEVKDVKILTRRELTRVGFPGYPKVKRAEITLFTLTLERRKHHRFLKPTDYVETRYDIRGVFYTHAGEKYRLDWLSDAGEPEDMIEKYVNIALTRIRARQKDAKAAT